MKDWTRISKAEWRAEGGLRNSNLCRVMRAGRWVHYRRTVAA
jgi:hypothetical protein